MALGQLGLAPLGSFGRAGASRYANAFDQQPYELTPEDEQGLLRSAVDVGLSGLAKAGNILDLPGSSVRDILSGENPFDQWAPWNWTSGQNRTSPEDMLQRFGVLSPQFRKQHPVWSFLGGLGAAVVTDPLLYTGLPGVSRLSQAGTIAKRSGLLKNLDSVLAPGVGLAEGRMTTTLGQLVPDAAEINRLRGLGRLEEMGAAQAKLTAADRAAAALGTTVDALRGETLGYRNLLPSQSMGLPFARGLDTASDWLGKTLPVRVIGAAFQASKGGRLDEWGQKIAGVRHNMLPEARTAANAASAGFADEMRTVGEAFKTHFGPLGLNDDEVFALTDELLPFIEEAAGRGMNAAARATSNLPQYDEGLRLVAKSATERINAARTASGAAPITGITPGDILSGPIGQMEALTTKIAATNKGIRDQIERMGGVIGSIDIHAPRFLGNKALTAMQAEAMRSGRSLGVKGASQMGRSEQIATIYRPVVNTMLKDDALRTMPNPAGTGGTVAADAAHVKAALLNPAGTPTANYSIFLDDTYKAEKELADAWANLTPPVPPKGVTWTPAQTKAAWDAAWDAASAPIRAAAREKHADDLAKWVLSHKKQDMFTNPSLLDEATYLASQYKTQKSIEAIHELFRKNAADAAGVSIVAPARTFAHGRWQMRTPNVIPNPPGVTPDTFTTMRQAFEDAGLNADQGLKHMAEKMGVGVDDVEKMAVPAALANSATGLMEAVTNTKFQSWIGSAIDAMNRVFKIGVTAHPANWVRNWYSGQMVNLTASGEIHGAGDIANYVSRHRYASQHINDPALIRDAIIHGAIDPEFGSEGVQLGTRLGSNLDVFSGLPVTGAAGKPIRRQDDWWNVKQAFKDAQAAPKGTVSGAFDIATGQQPGYTASKVSGMGSIDDAAARIQTMWKTGVNTSAKANAKVEWQNRISMYLYLQDRGWSKAAAAEKVRALQLDYRHGLSGFEKSVMRRAIPFYSFSRMMAPTILRTLRDKPGGVMAQMIKASSRMGGRDAMTPEYVSEGLSVPLGTTPQGDVRYFSATGMPYEDLFAFFGGRSPSRTMGLEAASRLTPYLKGPAEWVTGRSFFQQGPSGGRDISDLDPVLGRTVSNATQYIRWLAGDKTALKERPLPAKLPAALEQLVSNSPLSRYATSTRTLLDPRKNAIEKAVNLLSGARVTTISKRAQLAMAQERLGVLGKERFGLKDMIVNYIPEQELERLRVTDPEQYAEAMKFRALQSAINRERKALREQAKK